VSGRVKHRSTPANRLELCGDDPSESFQVLHARTPVVSWPGKLTRPLDHWTEGEAAEGAVPGREEVRMGLRASVSQVRRVRVVFSVCSVPCLLSP